MVWLVDSCRYCFIPRWVVCSETIEELDFWVDYLFSDPRKKGLFLRPRPNLRYLIMEINEPGDR